MEEEEIKRKYFEKLLPHWQCQSCKEPPGPRKRGRYLCVENNHPLCQDCNYKCPYPCGSNVTQNPCRQVERLVDSFPWFFCCNYQNGCREISKEDGLENHQNSCQFRRIQCPFLNCSRQPIFKDLFDHLDLIHEYEILECEEKDCEIKPSQNYWCTFTKSFDINLKTLANNNILKPTMFKMYEGSTFFLVGALKNGLFHFWSYVYAISPSEAAENLKVKFEIGSYEEKDERRRLTSVPVTLDMKPQKVVEQHYGFIVGYKALEKLYLVETFDEKFLRFDMKIEALNLTDQRAIYDNSDTDISGNEC